MDGFWWQHFYSSEMENVEYKKKIFEKKTRNDKIEKFDKLSFL